MQEFDGTAFYYRPDWIEISRLRIEISRNRALSVVVVSGP